MTYYMTYLYIGTYYILYIVMLTNKKCNVSCCIIYILLYRLSPILYNSKYATGFTAIRHINCIERVMNCCYYNKIIYCLLSNKTGLITLVNYSAVLHRHLQNRLQAFILRINGPTLGVCI